MVHNELFPRRPSPGSLLRGHTGEQYGGTGSVCWKEKYAVPLQRILLVVLFVVIACIVFYAVLRRRHPVRSQRPAMSPCAALYRLLP